MLKTYQVVERSDGLWSVYKVLNQFVSTNTGLDLYEAYKAETEYFFTSAAEAQELADQLNEQEQDK